MSEVCVRLEDIESLAAHARDMAACIDKALEWIDRQLEVIDGQIMPPEKREAYTNALYHVRSVLSGSN